MTEDNIVHVGSEMQEGKSHGLAHDLLRALEQMDAYERAEMGRCPRDVTAHLKTVV
jgi:hypothetical protein